MGDERELVQLDEECVLEPAVDGAGGRALDPDPVLSDVEGRLWRVRRRAAGMSRILAWLRGLFAPRPCAG